MVPSGFVTGPGSEHFRDIDLEIANCESTCFTGNPDPSTARNTSNFDSAVMR
jgi:hypothetical protein